MSLYFGAYKPYGPLPINIMLNSPSLYVGKSRLSGMNNFGWTIKQKNICDMLLSVLFSIIAYNAIINAQRFSLQPEKHCQVHANEEIKTTNKRMEVSIIRSFFKKK